MLGEQIVQESGQITGMRVLPSEGGAARVEVSFQSSGTTLGIQGSNMGTYVSVTRPDGTLFGEGQGVVMTNEGEMVTWQGQGVGRFTGQGSAISWRGSVFFQTASQGLARLNGIAGMFEYETDESGKSENKIYEWK